MVQSSGFSEGSGACSFVDLSLPRDCTPAEGFKRFYWQVVVPCSEQCSLFNHGFARRSQDTISRAVPHYFVRAQQANRGVLGR